MGTWKHYSAQDAWETVSILGNGQGRIEWYTNNKLYKDTKEKKWYIKENELFLGKVTFSLQPYDITSYPEVITQYEVIGFDTMKVGKRYIGLNDQNYVEIN